MEQLHRFPRMMQDYLVARLRVLYRANHERVMGLRTRAEALDYVRDVRSRVGRLFPPAPPCAPLNVRTVATRDRPDYVLENLLFDSRPGWTVTANLYRPKASGGPRPAVLCLCGHSQEGKAFELYQAFAQSLARQGYITLIFDPMGQGERVLFPDGHGGSRVGFSVLEHNMAGKTMLLNGDWIAHRFGHAGLRALDVLLQQEGVDPAHVGVTGNSGGGNMTVFAVACDPRITMSAPGCYVTSWYHNGINEEPQDAEQLPWRALEYGLEQSDLLLAGAPRPVILLTQEQDFFDQRGSREAFQRLKHVYRLLGAEDQVAYHHGPGEHGYHKDAREAMYGFFNRCTGLPGPVAEPELTIEDAGVLRCTDTGVVTEAGSRSLCDGTRERSRELADRRSAPDGEELVRRIRQLVKPPPRRTGAPYRILRPWSRRDYARAHASHYIIESDPEYGAQVIVTKLEDRVRAARPLPGTGPAVLYVPDLTADGELRDHPEVRSLQETHPAFFACDRRGTGESRPDTCRPDSYFDPYGSDYHYASYALMFGESYVAWHVHDILCVLDWMAEHGYNDVHLVASGRGAVPGALAAVLDARVGKVTLLNAPRSYAGMVESAVCDWPLSSLLPDVLRHFDLPDVYRALEGKGLTMMDS